jgi:hypothetical protein
MDMYSSNNSDLREMNDNLVYTLGRTIHHPEGPP